MKPGIEQLRRLCRFGFHGERLFNQDGHLDLVFYTRDFWGVREVVLVYHEGKALAYRTRDMLDPDSPLHITENAVEWRLHGDIVTVVNALLSLPTPGPPHVDGILFPSNDSRPEGYPVSSPVPDPPLISADAAARALQEHFLANADRGNDAANDELVAEVLRRMRALRASREGGC